MLLALGAMWVEGCVRPGPPVADSTPPKIVLTALGAVGNPTFASDEATTQPTDSCAKFRSFPGRFILSVGDSGGVALARVRVLFGRILRESVIVGPDAPESSWEITRPDGISDLLTIRLRPPGSGTVRTGLLALLDVAPNDSPPVLLQTSARDYSANVVQLYPVDARASGDAVVCR